MRSKLLWLIAGLTLACGGSPDPKPLVNLADNDTSKIVPELSRPDRVVELDNDTGVMTVTYVLRAPDANGIGTSEQAFSADQGFGQTEDEPDPTNNGFQCYSTPGNSFCLVPGDRTVNYFNYDTIGQHDPLFGTDVGASATRAFSTWKAALGSGWNVINTAPSSSPDSYGFDDADACPAKFGVPGCIGITQVKYDTINRFTVGNMSYVRTSPNTGCVTRIYGPNWEIQATSITGGGGYTVQQRRAANLRADFLHEFGHCSGLGHNPSDSSDIMYTYSKSVDPSADFSNTEKLWLQHYHQ